jgi:hypothetical protein
MEQRELGPPTAVCKMQNRFYGSAASGVPRRGRDAQVAFRGLNGGVPERELDLFEGPARPLCASLAEGGLGVPCRKIPRRPPARAYSRKNSARATKL